MNAEPNYSRSALIADCVAQANKSADTRGLGFAELNIDALGAGLDGYSIELNLGVEKTCYWQRIFPLGENSFGVWMPAMVGVYNYSNFIYTGNNRVLPKSDVIFDNFYTINSNLILDVQCTGDGRLGAVTLNIRDFSEKACSEDLESDSIFSCADLALCEKDIFIPGC